MLSFHVRQVGCGVVAVPLLQPRERRVIGEAQMLRGRQREQFGEVLLEYELAGVIRSLSGFERAERARNAGV